MSKSLGFAALLVVSLLSPASAHAAGIVFEAFGTTDVAGWKPVESATSTGTRGYWDHRSYDSATNANPAACAAGPLVAGITCDWNSPGGVANIDSPSKVLPGAGFEYFGLLDPLSPGVDAPLNFFFTGPFEFDWTVLFQLTAWDDHVEFGWYEAGNPDNRTPIFGPGGPYTQNDGQPGAQGTASMPTGNFGFYYRNSRFASGDVIFFTESRFNRTGGYFTYFAEWGLELPQSFFEDEVTFDWSRDAAAYQQFVIFRQGDLYWLGLEDQFGRVSPAFCKDVNLQPCSDYDFNDFLIGWTERRDVPEPGLLPLLGGAIATLAWRRRRR